MECTFFFVPFFLCVYIVPGIYSATHESNYLFCGAFEDNIKSSREEWSVDYLVMHNDDKSDDFSSDLKKNLDDESDEYGWDSDHESGDYGWDSDRDYGLRPSSDQYHRRQKSLANFGAFTASNYSDATVLLKDCIHNCQNLQYDYAIVTTEYNHYFYRMHKTLRVNCDCKNSTEMKKVTKYRDRYCSSCLFTEEWENCASPIFKGYSSIYCAKKTGTCKLEPINDIEHYEQNFLFCSPSSNWNSTIGKFKILLPVFYHPIPNERDQPYTECINFCSGRQYAYASVRHLLQQYWEEYHIPIFEPRPFHSCYCSNSTRDITRVENTSCPLCHTSNIAEKSRCESATQKFVYTFCSKTSDYCNPDEDFKTAFPTEVTALDYDQTEMSAADPTKITTPQTQEITTSNYIKIDTSDPREIAIPITQEITTPDSKEIDASDPRETANFDDRKINTPEPRLQCNSNTACKGKAKKDGTIWNVCRGAIGRKPCAYSKSNPEQAVWACSKNGIFLTEQPDYSSCSSGWLKTVEQEAKSTVFIGGTIVSKFSK